MSIATISEHLVDVEKADTSTRDTSGGVIDSSWSVEFSQIRGLLRPLSPQEGLEFARAGFSVTHIFATQQTGILAGRRLKDSAGNYYRVHAIVPIPAVGSLEAYNRVHCERVQLA